MKCWVNDVTINYIPKLLTNELTPHTHDIVIDIEESDAENNNLILTLIHKDATLYLPVHKPTREER